jgi:hypothetical protein
MKQSKKKIRKANIRRRTKKSNYRKNQKGGWGFFSRDPQIITDIMKIEPNYTNINVSFPFKNIQMDISLPDINLNKALDEWGTVTCFNTIKQQLTDTIRLLDRNKQESEMRKNIEILSNLNIQLASPLNFSVIPNIVAFIANPYDLSIIGDKTKSTYSELVEKNDYIGGFLQPKQQESSSVAAGQEITIPKEVPFLIRLMQQLTREIDSYIYYINGAKQPKFPISELDANLPYLYTTAGKGYGRLLNNIRTMYRGAPLDWSKVNVQILYCFLGSSPFENYYSLNFVRNILQPAVAQGSYPEFWYAKAKRDGGGSLIPDVSIDKMIRNYKDYYIDSKFFKLDPITETGEDGNFLQYVKNDVTILIKVDTSIIIEVVQIWYIYLTNIEAVARDGSTYNGLIIAAVVEKTITDITGGVVHYSSQFRWLITKSTRDNLLRNNITLPDPILRNLGEIIMSGDNKFTKAVKKVFNRSPPTTPPRLSKEGMQIKPHNMISDYIDEQGNVDQPGNWQQIRANHNEDSDDEVGGGKKNKTRKRSKKRSIKGKAK